MRREQTNKQGGIESATVGRHSRERQQEPPPVGDIARIETRETARAATIRRHYENGSKGDSKTGTRPAAERQQGRKPGRKPGRTEARAATRLGRWLHCGGCLSFGGWRLSVPPFKPLRVDCPPLSLFSLFPLIPLYYFILLLYIYYSNILLFISYSNK